ncbi:ROK family transcriptional regulator [Fodinicola feengrottensis]|uniref:ROK family transcriptional regulator n=1 Tax=Fodinicola feengrottensis TaxID=435914 RepID=A0ABN2GER9_9ACTN
MQASSSPALLREINCAKVFAALRGRDALRLTEIGELTGLSRPTVSQASEQLVAGGLAEYVEEEAADQPRIGRPARAVRFRRRAGYVLGIDIGPHKILAMLADLTGSVVAKKRRDDDFASSGQQVLAAVRETVTSLLKEAGIARHEVWSVTVGTPGIVDPHTRAVTFAPSLPDWNEIRLADALRRSFSAPIQVENDVNLAVIAERWLGVATGVSTVVFIQWGARVGAGLVIGDRLHRGAAGMAGEIGYLSVLDGQAGVVPDESGLGPLESRVGAGAIIEAAGSRRRRGRRADRRAEETDATAVFAAARAGDEAAAQAIDEVAARLARGLSALLLVLDPEMVVLGGGVSTAGPSLLSAIERHIEPLALAKPLLTLSALGDEATALGAVRLALTDVEDRLLPAATDPLAR